MSLYLEFTQIIFINSFWQLPYFVKIVDTLFNNFSCFVYFTVHSLKSNFYKKKVLSHFRQPEALKNYRKF